MNKCEVQTVPEVEFEPMTLRLRNGDFCLVCNDSRELGEERELAKNKTLVVNTERSAVSSFIKAQSMRSLPCETNVTEDKCRH